MRRFATTSGIAFALMAAPMTMVVGAQASASGWSISPAVNPTASGGQLTAVACPSATDCTAVGQYSDRTGNQVTLAEQWNGTAWSIETTPLPANQVGGLEAVACSAPSACTAAGYAYDAAGIRITLVERWNGTDWAIQPTPNPAAAEFERICRRCLRLDIGLHRGRVVDDQRRHPGDPCGTVEWNVLGDRDNPEPSRRHLERPRRSRMRVGDHLQRRWIRRDQHGVGRDESCRAEPRWDVDDRAHSDRVVCGSALRSLVH